MNHLNNILLEGILLEEPKVVATEKDGNSWGRLVKFSISSHKVYRNKKDEIVDESLIMPVLVWGDVSRSAIERLEKGMSVRVIGELRMSEWTSKSGEARKTFEIVASHVEFRWKKKSETREISEDELFVLDEVDEKKEAKEEEVVYSF